MPYGTVNLRKGVPKGETVITSAAGGGTVMLELAMLSRALKKPGQPPPHVWCRVDCGGFGVSELRCSTLAVQCCRAVLCESEKPLPVLCSVGARLRAAQSQCCPRPHGGERGGRDGPRRKMQEEDGGGGGGGR